jgi:hypothetical protein
MPSTLEARGDSPESPSPEPAAGKAPARAVRIVGRALLYATAIAVIVIFLPSVDHVFVYSEF